jgi:hypothetical protein
VDCDPENSEAERPNQNLLSGYGKGVQHCCIRQRDEQVSYSWSELSMARHIIDFPESRLELTHILANKNRFICEFNEEIPSNSTSDNKIPLADNRVPPSRTKSLVRCFFVKRNNVQLIIRRAPSEIVEFFHVYPTLVVDALSQKSGMGIFRWFQ